LGLARAVTLESKSSRNHGHNLLSLLRLHQPGGPGPRIYIPQENLPCLIKYRHGPHRNHLSSVAVHYCFLVLWDDRMIATEPLSRLHSCLFRRRCLATGLHATISVIYTYFSGWMRRILLLTLNYLFYCLALPPVIAAVGISGLIIINSCLLQCEGLCFASGFDTFVPFFYLLHVHKARISQHHFYCNFSVLLNPRRPTWGAIRPIRPQTPSWCGYSLIKHRQNVSLGFRLGRKETFCLQALQCKVVL
jgi:hypothetical protein